MRLRSAAWACTWLLAVFVVPQVAPTGQPATLHHHDLHLLRPLCRLMGVWTGAGYHAGRTGGGTCLPGHDAGYWPAASDWSTTGATPHPAAPPSAHPPSGAPGSHGAGGASHMPGLHPAPARPPASELSAPPAPPDEAQHRRPLPSFYVR